MDLTFLVRVCLDSVSIASLLEATDFDMRLNIPLRPFLEGDAGGLGEGKGTGFEQLPLTPKEEELSKEPKGEYILETCNPGEQL